ncbi:MAG: glutamate--tRNA ligase [Candidatus Bathyarchaeota archaeon]|nr:MAG: glutamate--tRNA ligase [Candidatus Bathyarchaeota archaeon]
MSSNAELRKKIRQIALINAVTHKGKAQKRPVIGKLLADDPSLKAKVKEIEPTVMEIVEEVNGLSFERQKKIVGKNWPESLIKERKDEKKTLPPLSNVDKYEVVITRFSPNPDGPIHLGSARAIILCHEYAQIYKGKFLVRFEDTDPKLKRPQLSFYTSIKKDLKWLNCEPDEYFIQSDRLLIYYEHIERLLQEGHAYICTCKSEFFNQFVLAKKPCPCRNLTAEEHWKRWQKMLDGTYKEGEAVARIKTDLTHPNPAVRDWPALRIVDIKKYPHPRVGCKYRVWPLYNLACGIDDHLMGVTHIIRGKEHLTNQIRQEFMYRYFGWIYPEAIHYGRMKISGASLSKSKMLREMREGLYTSWDDPRLATFAALRRRGVQADAIRRLIIDVGPKTQDLTLSWENLYAHNRRIIEPKANRYFFVHNPKKVIINNLTKTFTAKILLHPDYPERGFRLFNIKPKNSTAEFWVSTKDIEKMKKGQVIRFMELFNIRIDNVNTPEGDAITAMFHSEEYEEAKAVKAPLIHWIPKKTGVRCQVIMPDASTADGLVEESCRKQKADTIVQFERFGFVRIDSNKDSSILAYYCHR